MYGAGILGEPIRFLAWSTLASAFAPILLVYVCGGRMSEAIAIGMLVTGAAVALVWRWAGLHAGVYEGMPGILSGIAVYLVYITVLEPRGMGQKQA